MSPNPKAQVKARLERAYTHYKEVMKDHPRGSAPASDALFEMCNIVCSDPELDALFEELYEESDPEASVWSFWNELLRRYKSDDGRDE